MTREELSGWASAHGWRLIDGHPSLTKPSAPKGKPGSEAVVRLVLKATVAVLEAKKPAGKWEKLASAAYAKIGLPEDGELPEGLGLEALPGLRMLMQDNRDRQVFEGMGRPGGS